MAMSGRPFTMRDVYAHRKMCTAKAKRFSTVFDARIYIARRRFKNMRVYPCPYCAGFHMTSRPR
jgi:hypothetical protein